MPYDNIGVMNTCSSRTNKDMNGVWYVQSTQCILTQFVGINQTPRSSCYIEQVQTMRSWHSVDLYIVDLANKQVKLAHARIELLWNKCDYKKNDNIMEIS